MHNTKYKLLQLIIERKIEGKRGISYCDYAPSKDSMRAQRNGKCSHKKTFQTEVTNYVIKTASLFFLSFYSVLLIFAFNI